MSGSETNGGVAPAFEMVVLGSGGGPLETDSSGYLVKPYNGRWEDGILALEGGSGLGALAALFERKSPSDLFPDLVFPDTHNSPVLKAAYVFSLLACYLITHAHLDHCHSLILLSGSVPPRPTMATSSPSLLTPPMTAQALDESPQPQSPVLPRPPVYGTRKTLERLAMAYGGELWPELGTWAPEDASRSKRRKLAEKRGSITGDSDQMGSGGGTGVVFTPITPSDEHRQLHPTLPITIRKFHVLHGCTSKGVYESSAMFFRYDLGAMSATASRNTTPPSDRDLGPADQREFLFFGDVESDWRQEGEEDWDVDGQQTARAYNEAIWTEAARSWGAGRLAGVFIECSYASDRPAHLMFGHVSPPALYHELQRFARKVQSSVSPLSGLRVFITHIKDSLMPHPTGKCARERIMAELRELEREGKLGVEFVEVRQGDRILI